MAKPTGRPAGRPPKTIEQKRAEGNRGKRALPQAQHYQGLEEIPPPPPELTTAAGRRFWEKAWESGSKWLKIERDWSVVFEFASSWEEFTNLRKEMRRSTFPRIVEAPNGAIYLHPLYKREETLHARLNTLRSVLGFSPADYARLEIVEISDEEENEIINVMDQGR